MFEKVVGKAVGILNKSEGISFIFKLLCRLPNPGVKIMNEQWDYLIILDACRWDMFKKYNQINGRSEKKISRGSSTLEWLFRNFNDYYNDVIYISSNGFITNVKIRGFRGGNHFYKVVDVTKNGWDDKLSTVPPEEVINEALDVKEEYPDKRLIIHFMQPHGPFIGKTKILAKDIGKKGYIPTQREVQKAAWGGKIDENHYQKAWIDNLKFILKKIKGLVKKLDGKIIITADHGDLVGEYGMYGHISFFPLRKLREVPWLVIEK